MIKLSPSDRPRMSGHNGYSRGLPAASGLTLTMVACTLASISAGTLLGISLAPKSPERPEPIRLRPLGPIADYGNFSATLPCSPDLGMPICPPDIQPYRRLKTPLAICAVVRDDPDLLEWLEHNRRLGFGAFYLFGDHESTPSFALTQKNLTQGDVYYHSFNAVLGDHSAQSTAHNACITRFASRHQWMAFFDSDEFLFLPDPARDLGALLSRFSRYGGVAINWRVLGSSGHVIRAEGKLVDNYVLCYPADDDINRYAKVIANTHFLVGAGPQTHDFSFRDGRFVVDDALRPVRGAKTDRFSERSFVLYHYLTKSLAEHGARIDRRGVQEHPPSLNDIVEIDARATDFCQAARPGRGLGRRS